MSTISIIAAIADKSAIGKNQQLLCHMPSDMKRFKELTTGHAVIMGRKTFESLPVAPLPNRKNVVLTTMPEAGFVNCFACESMGAALDLCEKEDEIFIIGGALVYRQALRIADKMYITRIHHEFPDATSFFPVVNWDLWEETEREDHFVTFKMECKNRYLLRKISVLTSEKRYKALFQLNYIRLSMGLFLICFPVFICRIVCYSRCRNRKCPRKKLLNLDRVKFRHGD